MECPYCNTDLNHEDTYGYLASHQSGEVLGQIYRCPNHDGFESEEEAIEFLIVDVEEATTKEEAIQWMKTESMEWEDVVCQSACHSVGGSFYTDKQDNLHDGYPC